MVENRLMQSRGLHQGWRPWPGGEAPGARHSLSALRSKLRRRRKGAAHTV